MTLNDYINRTVPEYYRTMYLDGFSPEQIHYAAKRKMLKEMKKEKDLEEAVEKAVEESLDKIFGPWKK